MDNRDYKISYIRAIATIMIVLLHIVQKFSQYYFGIEWISDWLNVGLVLFFVITAFLYSKREIPVKSLWSWFRNRYITLIIPALFTTIMTLTYINFFGGEIDRNRVVIAVLSGIGLEALLPNGWLFVQYWFLTYIIVCYFTIPFMCKINFKEMSALKFWTIIIAISVLMQGISTGIGLITSIPLLSVAILLRFYFPYALFRRYDIESKILEKIMKLLTIITAVGIVVVCLIRYYIKPIGVYGAISELLFIYIQTISGVVLFYWLYKLFGRIKERKKLLRITDRYSYPIYLTHCLFIGYSTSIIDRFKNKGVGTIVALICTVLASILVLKVTMPIKNRILNICTKRKISQHALQRWRSSDR